MRLSAMGDVAMTVPILRAFVLQFPDIKITVISSPFFKPFFDEIPNVTFFEFDKKDKHKGFLGLFRLFLELRKRNIDAFADLHNVLRSKVIRVLFALSGKKAAKTDKGRAEKKEVTRSENKIFRQLTTVFERHTKVFQALGFSLDLSNPTFPDKKNLDSETLAIVGASGSGKSTLLHLIGAMDQPTKGRVVIDGQDLTKMTEPQKDLFRRDKIGIIFQAFNLVGNLTALENVLVPFLPRGITPELRDRAKAMLTKVGLGHRLTHRPIQMSGGEQQRVAIARALVKNPQVVLADEPTGQLDTRTGEDVFRILRELQRELGTTLVVVTHDRRFIQPQDLVLEIEDGLLKK